MDGAGFVTDANVLIDYCNAELSILALSARVLGPIYVPVQVLAKVNQIDRSGCDHIGLTPFEPSTEQLLEAGQGSPRLAFDDRVCLIVCRDNHWACLTNDKALRRACAEAGIQIIWGLELMVQLVGRGCLHPVDALHVAGRIHTTNPAFVDRSILQAFTKKISKLMSGAQSTDKENI